MSHAQPQQVSLLYRYVKHFPSKVVQIFAGYLLPSDISTGVPGIEFKNMPIAGGLRKWVMLHFHPDVDSRLHQELILELAHHSELAIMDIEFIPTYNHLTVERNAVFYVIANRTTQAHFTFAYTIHSHDPHKRRRANVRIYFDNYGRYLKGTYDDLATGHEMLQMIRQSEIFQELHIKFMTLIENFNEAYAELLLSSQTQPSAQSVGKEHEDVGRTEVVSGSAPSIEELEVRGSPTIDLNHPDTVITNCYRFFNAMTSAVPGTDPFRILRAEFPEFEKSGSIKERADALKELLKSMLGITFPKIAILSLLPPIVSTAKDNDDLKAAYVIDLLSTAMTYMNAKYHEDIAEEYNGKIRSTVAAFKADIVPTPNTSAERLDLQSQIETLTKQFHLQAYASPERGKTSRPRAP